MSRSVLDDMFSSGFSDKGNQNDTLDWLEADQLLKEGIKSASLFMRGKVGLVSSATLYILDEIKPRAKSEEQLIDAGLGALKGTLLHFSFHGLQSFPAMARLARDKGINSVVRKGLTADPLLKYFPEKLNLPARAMGMGIASSVVESGCSRNTWINKDGQFDLGHGSSEIANRSASLPALVGYAGVFGSGMVLSKGINRLTKGLLERNSVAAASTMNASVGLISGGLGEVSRENAAGEHLDVGKIATKSLLNAGISAIAAVPGAIHSERQVVRELTVKPREKGIQVEAAGSGKVELLTCHDEPEALLNYFKRNGQPSKPCGVEVDANYYRVKGLDTLIVVPQAKGRQVFSGSLDKTLTTVAQVLHELPNANLIKEVQVYDQCAWPRFADANGKGRIRLFVGSMKFDFGRNLRHEGGHIQDFNQPGLNAKFEWAAKKEDAYDDGWNPATGGFLEHARKNADENLATLSERLQGRSAEQFIECLQDGKAPLRSIIYAEALKKAAEENKQIDPAYLRRLDVISEYVRPKNAVELSENIQSDIMKIQKMWDKLKHDEKLSKHLNAGEIVESIISDTMHDVRMLGDIGSSKDLRLVQDVLSQASEHSGLATQAFKTGLELLADNPVAKAAFLQKAVTGNHNIDIREQHNAINWLKQAVDERLVPESLKTTVDGWYVKHHQKVLPITVFEWLATLAQAERALVHDQIFGLAKERYLQQNSLFKNCQSLIDSLNERFVKSK